MQDGVPSATVEEHRHGPPSAENKFPQGRPRRANCSCGWRSPRPTIASGALQLLDSLAQSTGGQDNWYVKYALSPRTSREPRSIHRSRCSIERRSSHNVLALRGCGIVSAVSIASSLPRPSGHRKCLRLRSRQMLPAFVGREGRVVGDVAPGGDTGGSTVGAETTEQVFDV